MKSLLNLLKSRKNESTVMRGAHAALTVESANKIIQDIFGSDSAKYIEVIYYKNGILGVRCNGSSANLEVKMHENEILAKIKQEFEGINLQKIKIIF